jgi:hypothetical protein
VVSEGERVVGEVTGVGVNVGYSRRCKRFGYNSAAKAAFIETFPGALKPRSSTLRFRGRSVGLEL